MISVGLTVSDTCDRMHAVSWRRMRHPRPSADDTCSTLGSKLDPSSQQIRLIDLHITNPQITAATFRHKAVHPLNNRSPKMEAHPRSGTKKFILNPQAAAFIPVGRTTEIAARAPSAASAATTRTPTASTSSIPTGPSTGTEKPYGGGFPGVYRSDPELYRTREQKTNYGRRRAGGALNAESNLSAAWERHTSGAGSAIMRKMGFDGRRLGKHGQGLAVPLAVVAAERICYRGQGLGARVSSKKKAQKKRSVFDLDDRESLRRALRRELLEEEAAADAEAKGTMRRELLEEEAAADAEARQSLSIAIFAPATAPPCATEAALPPTSLSTSAIVSAPMLACASPTTEYAGASTTDTVSACVPVPAAMSTVAPASVAVPTPAPATNCSPGRTSAAAESYTPTCVLLMEDEDHGVHDCGDRGRSCWDAFLGLLTAERAARVSSAVVDWVCSWEIFASGQNMCVEEP